MTGLILGAILLAGLAFIGWKFMVGNRKHTIATTIITGTNAGLEQILPQLNEASIHKDLVSGAEFLTRYFFQSLGLAQYKGSSERLKLASIPASASSEIEAQVAQSIIARITPPEGDLQKTKAQLTQIANDFTQQMNAIQSQQENVEACAIPLVQNVANQLGSVLFTAGSYDTHKATFQTALTNALDATCANIYRKLSGKGDTGRYLGGGCC